MGVDIHVNPWQTGGASLMKRHYGGKARCWERIESSTTVGLDYPRG